MPRINGAKVFGVRPGAPLLFQIAATGERPMSFSAANLPPGLTLDSEAGQLSGLLAERGEHVLTLRASNSQGSTERTLRIVVGEEIALTPPMGWNSWNVWGGRVTQARVSAAARALVTSGLRDHGWSYVNIDDGWQGLRGGEFNAIQSNGKFPDMQQLADEIHAQGLKFGIYSSPWRTTFHGHIGSSADHEDGTNEWIRQGKHDENFRYRFPKEDSRLDQISWLEPAVRWLREQRRDRVRKELRTFGRHSFVKQDVAQWKRWGVDYLKYDWVPIDVPHAEEMQRELRASGRDVVYSVANNAPFAEAAELSRVANAWRTSGDVRDTWRSMSKTGFSRERWAPFQRPGHYNDPDMFVLGEVGWGKPRPTRLTANEQYTHMSLWCLLGAPLLLGCHLEKLDAFTLGLLTNDEVLAVNQDSLCKQATRVSRRRNTEVYAKPLEDGSWAVGLFNRGSRRARVSIQWSDLRAAGPQAVRDLWRQQDVGVFHDQFGAEVAPHGVFLAKIAPAR
ncbi:MAG TPA: putative Ig domain-containing protein [Chthoniobacterales bacterium]|nr:putative Ig domain-containing protein [Chthoniobacterales bacterium]